jgi:hypothetical protein
MIKTEGLHAINFIGSDLQKKIETKAPLEQANEMSQENTRRRKAI